MVVFVGSDDRISHVLKGKEAKLANLGKGRQKDWRGEPSVR